MNTTKKILSTIPLLAAMRIGFGYASTGWSDNVIPVEEMYNQVSCATTGNIYLNQDNDGDNLADVFFYLNSNFLLSGTVQNHSAGQILRTVGTTHYTKVKYYTPWTHMLYKIDQYNTTGHIDDYTFWRTSGVFPYYTPVRGIASTPNKIVFEQPKDNDTEKSIISIVYEYKYKYALGFDGTTTSEYRYHQIPDIGYMGNTLVTLHQVLPGSHGNRKRSWSAIQTHSSCINYKLNRCGDGKVDSYTLTGWSNEFEDEVCDDGPNNGLPGYCPLDCGRGGSIPRCGDNIAQEFGSTPYDSNNDGKDDGESWEECDDGDDPNDLLPDGDGAINTETISDGGFCSTICLYHFIEAFVEAFIDA